MKKPSTNRFAVIIPVYNHGVRVADVIRKTLKLNLPVFVVNDGSTDNTREIISKFKGITILDHTVNRGKGAAIKTGFSAIEKTADWAITLDADGQHDPEDILKLIQNIPHGQRPIVIGMRKDMRKANAPWTSRYGRRFSNFWVRISGGPKINDSQSGFRIYPLPECTRLRTKANRFQFEVEILVKARQKDILIIETPVRISYNGENRVSHFHPWKDFLRNFWMFTQLIVYRIFNIFSIFNILINKMKGFE